MLSSFNGTEKPNKHHASPTHQLCRPGTGVYRGRQKVYRGEELSGACYQACRVLLTVGVEGWPGRSLAPQRSFDDDEEGSDGIYTDVAKAFNPLDCTKGKDGIR